GIARCLPTPTGPAAWKVIYVGTGGPCQVVPKRLQPDLNIDCRTQPPSSATSAVPDPPWAGGRINGDGRVAHMILDAWRARDRTQFPCNLLTPTNYNPDGMTPDISFGGSNGGVHFNTTWSG